MKVIVKDKYLNIRAGSPSLNAPSYQYLAPGSQIEVDGKLYKGDPYDGNDVWLKDGADNYYWIGGVQHDIPTADLLEFKAAGQKQTFPWFDSLKIGDVWSQHTERGARATVAILDTGYNSANRDLTPKITSANTKVFIKPEVYPGLTLTIEDKDRQKHGTRCASLAGAINNDKWIIGVAPECKLLIGKISYDGTLPDFQYILDGIDWAIKQKADVISISYYVGNLSAAKINDFQQQLNTIMANNDVLIFASSGNSGTTQITADYYPASFVHNNVISVGASTLNGQIAPVTVLSSKTILHAPGENIESYNPQGVPSPETGTSFSTPIAAGIAALAVSYLKRKNGSWSAATLKAKMISTADTINTPGNKKIINPVNLFKAL
ncbi:S8 family peptidase [Mucilaginibacter kameinonensis]|uniref:S8 family peptidase n=1 Tax=Mucilaginibacter kameinonensis TaxID=452286 RepID=UPI000EF84681|nr:S8/S53 family peptidase [Mucilaginibacter kameinonensis]